MIQPNSEVNDGRSVSRSVGAVAHVERLAKWWANATQAERFRIFGRAIAGDKEVPPLETLQLACYLAEVANGEVRSE